MRYSVKTTVERAVNIITLLILLFVVIYAIYILTSGRIHKPQNATVELDSLQQVMETVGPDGESAVLIEGTVYKPYCDFGYVDGVNILERIEISDPIAYSFVGEQFYIYYSNITNLPEKEWIASFGEDGSAGKITKNNCQMIWKAEDTETVPEWLESYRDDYLEATSQE